MTWGFRYLCRVIFFGKFRFGNPVASRPVEARRTTQQRRINERYPNTLFWDAKPRHSLKIEYFMMTVVWRQNRAIDANKTTSDLESFSELKYIVRGTSPSI
jgi:hypothetical protein